MYRSKLRSTTSSAAAWAPPQYRELDLCAGGAARSRLSGAPLFASVVAHASAMPDTAVARLQPEALELEGVWVSKSANDTRRSAAVRAPMPGSRRVARVTSAARRAVLTSAETGKLAVAALNHSCRAQKRAALQQWTIYRRFGSLHDACVHKGELASDWCEKPVLTTRSRAASRAFSTARARCWTSLYYLLEDRSSRGPRAGAGRVSCTHRRSVRHSSESSS